MIEIEIPGYKTLSIEHLVLDFNGTIAYGGELMPGVDECIDSLSHKVEIHVLTADTFGKADEQTMPYLVTLKIIGQENQDVEKQNYIKELGPQKVVAIGNGRNDKLMLKEAELGICVVEGEGAAMETLLAADIAVPDIVSALQLLDEPLRLTATLRN